ncbi:MAG: hypothetical protein GX540_05975, partial [Clostridiales bacterium]|nr:hypothetical protein [Clostridiales bacterium]
SSLAPIGRRKRISEACRAQIDARSGIAVLKEAINWKEMAGVDPRWY